MLRGFPDIICLGCLHPIFHPLGKLFKLLLGVGKLLPSFREMLLRLLRQFIFLELILMPLHAVLGFPDLLNGFRNGLANIALLGLNFLPRQRIGITINLNEKPLRAALIWSAQRFWQVVEDHHRKTKLFGILVFLGEGSERDEFRPAPEGSGAQSIALRQAGHQGVDRTPVDLKINPRRDYPEILSNLILKLHLFTGTQPQF